MRRYSRESIVLLLFILVSALPSSTCSHRPELTSTTIIVPDDFPTIQEAINNATGGDSVFVRVGTYYEHVVVNKTVSILGENVDATIIDGNHTGHVIHIITDNVSISGFTVQNGGNISMPSLDAGICLNGTTNCSISNNRLVDNGFAGISLLDSQRNTITGNNATRIGWGGIHLLNSRYNIISENIMDDMYVGINGHVSSHHNNITGNIIANSTYGMFYHNSIYNRICGNNISNIEVEGIELQDLVNYNIIAENNLNNCSVGIKLQGPNNNNILSGNILTGGQSGIHIMNTRYTEIWNNTITHCNGSEWDAAIRLDSTDYTRIHTNIITNNWRGILLYTTSPRVSIYNNTLTNNEFALRVASGGSNYLNISDNIVMNNRGYGIGLTGFGSSSNYATISRNLIVNNSDGIALGQYSNFHTIHQNNISQNEYGFYIDYSTQNTIWGNNLIDNDQQVYVSATSINNWDGGYLTGGNYWSDYDGNDTFCGPNQDLPGGDKKGDTPYLIDENNQDRYPLMDQHGPGDTTPPQFANWTQTPPEEEIQPGVPVFITIDVTDPSGVQTVALLYRHNSTGSWSGWIEITMNHTIDNSYDAAITPFQEGTTVEYYIRSTDYLDNCGLTPEEEYSYSYHVIPEFTQLTLLAMFLLLVLTAIALKKKSRPINM